MKTRVTVGAAILAMLMMAIPAGAVSPGTVVWEDTFHLDAAAYDPDLVEAAAGTVVMVGTQVTDAGAQDLRITAFSAGDGAVLWDTTYDRAGGYEFATDVIVTPKDVLVAGGAQATATGNVDGLLLRYGAKTGQLIWSAFYDRSGNEEAFLGVDMTGWRIVVTGQSLTASMGPADAITQSYDLRDGSLLWSDIYDATGQWDVGNAVAIAGKTAVTTGQATGTDGRYDLLMMGHDLKSGDRLWTETYDKGGSTRGLAAAASGNTVYAVGDDSAFEQSADMMVRAYTASTGALVWADSYDVAGFYDSAYDVDVAGGVVVATGEGRPSQFSPDLLTRAYDATTGTLLWSAPFDLAGSTDQSRAVEITDSLAVIAAAGYDEDHEWVVRAYDLSTGLLAWQEVLDRSGGSDSARDVAALGTSVFVVGSTQEAGTGFPGTHADGTIRAYRR